MRDLLAVEEEWYAARVGYTRTWLRPGGVVDTSPEAAAKLVPTRRPNTGSVAVIPVSGFLTQRPTLFSMIFGGTSFEGVAADVAEDDHVERPSLVVQDSALAQLQASADAGSLGCVARPASKRPVYGLYAWCGEYRTFRDSIRKVGWRSIRIAGPADDATMAMMAAYQLLR